MDAQDGTCEYWSPSDCTWSPQCPPRCPRFVDGEGHPWVVRPADDGDRDAVVAMYEGFATAERAQGLPPRTRSRIESWIDEMLATGCNFVASGPDGVAGHALYTPTDDREPEFAVFVHQDYQHRGLGTELSKHVLAAAAIGDRDALTLIVDPNNRVARRLYDRLGFEVAAEYDADVVGARSPTMRMRRELDPADAVSLRRENSDETLRVGTTDT